jgi:hypothetical protein
VEFKRNLQEAGIEWKFYKNAECVASEVVDSKAFKNGAWKDINLIIMFLAVSPVVMREESRLKADFK